MSIQVQPFWETIAAIHTFPRGKATDMCQCAGFERGRKMPSHQMMMQAQAGTGGKCQSFTSFATIANTSAIASP